MKQEEVQADKANGKIPINDKRRFNADGEYVAESEAGRGKACWRAGKI
jgi:hypothetical protein